VRKLVPLIVIAAIASAVGCKRPGSARLEGHWRGTRAGGVVAGAQDGANAFASQTEIIARGTQIAVSFPSSRPQQGTFVVDEENKTTLVLHTEKDGPAARETFVFGEDGRTMTWRLGDGRTITFEKVKEP
jgi:hypothetical protein